MTETIRVVVADDEPLAVSRLVGGLEKMPGVEVVGTAQDGKSALDLIKSTSPDIAFLDIKMPSLSGIDVAAALNGTAPAIIFVTAFGRFAIKAFELAAVDYLLKPVDFGRVREAIDRAMERRRATHAEQRAQELQGLLDTVRTESLQSLELSQSAGPSFWLRDREGHVRVPRASIEMLQADRDYVHVHTRGRKYLVRETLHAFLEQLQSADFVRVHRSYVVNVAFVERVSRRPGGSTDIVMASSASVPVGRNYANSVRSLLAVLERKSERKVR